MGRPLNSVTFTTSPGGPFRKARVVLACGCFDLFHYGHLRHLEAAKGLLCTDPDGGTLVVLVTPDEWVNKGRGRPVYSEDQRLAIVAGLACVDYAVLNNCISGDGRVYGDAVGAIHKIRPDYYVKGKEYEGKLTPALEREKAAVEAVGGKLVFVGEDLVHTTDLTKKYFSGRQMLEEHGCK